MQQKKDQAEKHKKRETNQKIFEMIDILTQRQVSCLHKVFTSNDLNKDSQEIREDLKKLLLTALKEPDGSN